MWWAMSSSHPGWWQSATQSLLITPSFYMNPYVWMGTLSLVSLRHDVTIWGGGEEVRGRAVRQGSVDLEEGGPVCLAHWLGVILPSGQPDFWKCSLYSGTSFRLRNGLLVGFCLFVYLVWLFCFLKTFPWLLKPER